MPNPHINNSITDTEQPLPPHFFKMLFGLLFSLITALMIFAVSISKPVPLSNAPIGIPPEPTVSHIQVDITPTGKMVTPTPVPGGAEAP